MKNLILITMLICPFLASAKCPRGEDPLTSLKGATLKLIHDVQFAPKEGWDYNLGRRNRVGTWKRHVSLMPDCSIRPMAVYQEGPMRVIPAGGTYRVTKSVLDNSGLLEGELFSVTDPYDGRVFLDYTNVVKMYLKDSYGRDSEMYIDCSFSASGFQGRSNPRLYKRLPNVDDFEETLDEYFEIQSCNAVPVS